jgi:uncharacterized protein YodC (DUF2158 family)
MTRKFQPGDEVVHKSNRDHRMTVVEYTNDTTVICRWREKTKFQTEEFQEAELEKWIEPEPAVPFVINPSHRRPY